MSKAFTREDADASFDAPTTRAPQARHSGARLTAYGARVLRDRLLAEPMGAVADRLRLLLAGADLVEPAGADHVALGARVRVHGKSDRTVVIATPDEVGLVPEAISAASPLGHALVGARVGDQVELDLPRGQEELTVVAIDWPV